jgi:hypothetical protein
LFTDAPSQYNFIVSTINAISEDQAQLKHTVKAMQNKDKLRDCKNHEEQEGRQNCDLLTPYFDPGQELQSALQEQVLFYSPHPELIL